MEGKLRVFVLLEMYGGERRVRHARAFSGPGLLFKVKSTVLTPVGVTRRGLEFDHQLIESLLINAGGGGKK